MKVIKVFFLICMMVSFISFLAARDAAPIPGVGFGSTSDKTDNGSGSVSIQGDAKYNYQMGNVTLSYSSNGGWGLQGSQIITRDTSKGIPTYNSETEVFLCNGMELVLINDSGSMKEIDDEY